MWIWYILRPTHLSVLGEIDFEGFGIVLESKRGHSKENVLSINRLSLLLLAFF